MNERNDPAERLAPDQITPEWLEARGLSRVDADTWRVDMVRIWQTRTGWALTIVDSSPIDCTDWTTERFTRLLVALGVWEDEAKPNRCYELTLRVGGDTVSLDDEPKSRVIKMKSNPEFREALNKLRRIALQELRDGCVDCPEKGIMCSKHLPVAMDMFMNPKKYFAKEMEKWQPSTDQMSRS